MPSMADTTPRDASRFRRSWWPGALPAAVAAVWAGLLGLAGAAAQAPSTPASGDLTLSILGTTDLHGYVFPREGRGGLAVFGGYLANLRAARAADGGGVVLLDAGDTYLGGIESNMSEGAVVVDAFNALGYTAGALGNHDLEYGAVDHWPFGTGTGDPRGAIKALARRARYPMLAANLTESAALTPVDWPNVMPSALVTVAGVRVGLVGVMTYDALSLTLAANVVGLATTPLVGAIVREATAVRGLGAQVVVAVAHAGGSCGAFSAPEDLTSCDDTSEIFDVARRLPAGLVDVIVAGHTHDGLAHRVAGIPIVQAFSWGRAFSRVDLRVSRPTGTVRAATIFAPQEICAWQDAASGVCVPAASATTAVARYEGRPVTPRAAVNDAMAPQLARVDGWRRTPLGVALDGPLGRGPGDAESPLGNLFADALAAAVPGSDGALSYGAGPGGLRADLAAGPLTVGGLYDSFPFDNRLVALGLRGADLRALLRDHLQRPRWRARALGVSGLRLEIGCRGGRDDVEITRASGQPIADDEPLTIVVPDFLAARVRALTRPGADAITSAPSDRQVRDAALTWVRGRRDLTTAAFVVPGAPRWTRTEASVAGCQTGPGVR
ncbi:MAG: 5'-nucleotidase C-terminal domain-containing protein [Acidobacteria bacterium]|nr:5'-nucleotidase C-terminal domain-containing protein [Acidobacteriota bacterium]